MNNTFNPNITVPKAELLIRLLNGDDSAIIELLDYYDSYITASASIPVLNADGQREGIFVSDDLKQEIIYRILRSIPIIRGKIRASLEPQKPYIVVIRDGI